MPKKNRISPPLKVSRENQFSNLKVGDCFIDAAGDLLIKTSDEQEQSAVSLATGTVYSDLCDCQVMPTDIQITWKKK
jgi:hypothetical protein